MQPSIQHRDLAQARPQLFIADWLSRHNNNEGKDEEILGMSLIINAVETCTDIPKCMMAEEIRQPMQDDDHPSAVSTYRVHGWPSTRAQVWKELQPYWPFRDDITVKDRIAMMGQKKKNASIPATRSPRSTACQQHGHREALACETIFWISINNIWKMLLKLPYMSLFSGKTDTEQNTTMWDTRKTVGDCWSWYFHIKQ